MILAGTGHRPDKLGGYGLRTHLMLRGLAIAQLEKLKPDYVISGMALGWDQALADAALIVKIPYRAYVPFVGQESKWPEPSQLEYTRLLRAAETVIFTAQPGYAPWKMQRRNEAMVDAATDVLALWNEDKTGGTYNCVQYAERRSKPIHNCWAHWAELTKRFP